MVYLYICAHGVQSWADSNKTDHLLTAELTVPKYRDAAVFYKVRQVYAHCKIKQSWSA